MALSLPQILAAGNRAAAHARHGRVADLRLPARRALSTIDTLDLKPDAPAEFRGEFSPIADQRARHPDRRATCPKLARQMDKFSLIRSFGHQNSDHGPADHYMLTGYFPTAGFNPNLTPNNQRPSLGSIIARKLGPQHDGGRVPPYVCLPQMHPAAARPISARPARRS